MLATATKFDVRFSVTARQDKRVRAAIDAIPHEAWQPIPYWLSTPEVSGADIAETPFIVFAGDKRHARPVRLVVRPGPPDTRQPAGAVHRLGLPRVHHRPDPSAGRAGGRPPAARRRRAEHR